tara:strand:+ start:438 stop:686 length:249 start_codon:yes stop_codon:yes gene_type:complete
LTDQRVNPTIGTNEQNKEMAEIKKTALFYLVGSVVLAFAFLVERNDAFVYDQESLSSLKNAIHTQGRKTPGLVDHFRYVPSY